ncbi:MAG: sigma-70 family RNA polymerase sigma factor [Herpetosiphon sp.]|nr:sigma-70 family RNA polymerase sigma factor [Herpetosiphon sp.]
MTTDGVHLLMRIAAGDETAFKTFYQQYVNLVFSMALHVLRDQSLAEEVAQDVLVTVWRRATLFNPERGTVSSWLLTITRRRAIDYLRLRANLTPLLSDEEWARQPAMPAVIPDVDLQSALAQLPSDQRDPLNLVYFGGLTQAEAAEQLDVPLGTLKSRIRLALQRLRHVLGSWDD